MGVAMVFLYAPRLVAQAPVGQPLRLNYFDPVSYTIDSVSFQGLVSHSARLMRAISGIDIGDRIKIPGQKVSLAIRKLYDKDW